MGFTAELTVERIASRLIIKIAEGPDNALLIGGRGNTLESLELLIARILIKKLKDAAHPEAAELRVVLDVADYRARRQAAVLDSLRVAAATVRRTKKPQTLSALNSAERRLVREALKPHRDLSLRNDAPRDCVIISAYHAKEKRN
jgi:spoIIIJ-associated protein